MSTCTISYHFAPNKVFYSGSPNKMKSLLNDCNSECES